MKAGLSRYSFKKNILYPLLKSQAPNKLYWLPCLPSTTAISGLAKEHTFHNTATSPNTTTFISKSKVGLSLFCFCVTLCSSLSQYLQLRYPLLIRSDFRGGEKGCFGSVLFLISVSPVLHAEYVGNYPFNKSPLNKLKKKNHIWQLLQ